MKTVYSLALALMIGLICVPAAARETRYADEIYQTAAPAIYQIRVMDLASGKKSSIGSGFQFTADGHVATNFHVIADFVHHPQAYKIQYLAENGTLGEADVLITDVVHDLAILKIPQSGTAAHLKLGTSQQPKGARIFSMGNPHDLGLTITEGAYNGISDMSYFEKIHFSGSVNPGMSGGPALDSETRVIGINVMTAGNQISFLVPVEHLATLYQNYQANPALDFIKDAPAMIEAQLSQTQDAHIDALIKADWPLADFGPVQVPGRISEEFKCWGRSNTDDAEKNKYTHFISTCSTQDEVYISGALTTGLITYRYDSIAAPQSLLPRFYALYRDVYSWPVDAYDNATEKDVTDFECQTGFIEIAQKTWRSDYCVRGYKKYKSLFDVHHYMAAVDIGKRGLKISLAMQGVTRSRAQAFSQKFLQQIKWFTPSP